MEKLSIREASQRFGLSRARLYQLLDKGTVDGHRSGNHAGGSWINQKSIENHLKIRDQKHGQGRPKVISDGDKYLSVRDAAKKTGYSTRHIYLLMSQGFVTSRYSPHGKLVYYPDLLRHKNTK